MKAKIKVSIKFAPPHRIDVTYRQELTEEEANEFLKYMMEFQARLSKKYEK